MELQSELACRDEGKSLEQFIELSIKLDNLLRSRRPNHLPVFPMAPSAAHADVKPMKIGVTHISEEERERETHSTEFMLVLRITGTSTSVLSHLFISQPGCSEYEFQIYYQFRLQSLWRLRQGL